jgi:hypothetical protein
MNGKKYFMVAKINAKNAKFNLTCNAEHLEKYLSAFMSDTLI